MPISYNDKSYIDKRLFLRNFYRNDINTHKCVKLLAFKVKKRLTNPIIDKLLDYDTIIKFLIDGYLSYELINIDGNLEYKELDPTSLQIIYCKSKCGKKWEKMWAQNAHTKIERKINYDDIIYIHHHSFSELSFTELVYKGFFDYEKDKDLILDYTDYILDRFQNKNINPIKTLNVDFKIKRLGKIKKVCARSSAG